VGLKKQIGELAIFREKASGYEIVFKSQARRLKAEAPIRECFSKDISSRALRESLEPIVD
jgi:hypothetical protein